MKIVRKGNLLLMLLVGMHVFSQQLDWNAFELKGKVKSIEIIKYAAGDKFGEITKMEILEGERYQFNNNGLVIEEKHYAKAGTPVEQLYYKYDSLNNLVEQNILDSKGVLQRKILREYNQFNKTTYETIYGSDGILVARSVFQYKEGIIPQKVVTFDKNGVEINLKEYIYNKKTATKSITTTNPKSKVIESAKKYDANKNLIEVYTFDVEGNLKSDINYMYNIQNKLVESKYFFQGKLMVKRTLTYNNLGFLVEVHINYPEKQKTDIITYKYDFDEKANWIKSVEYVNSIPIKLTERTLVYY